MKKTNLILPLLILLLIVLGCHQKRTKETIRGRLKYVETSYSGTCGHGNEPCWTRGEQYFYVNGWKWSPPGLEKDQDMSRCDGSPNEAVEAIRCIAIINQQNRGVRGASYIFRMNDDQPELTKIMDEDFYANGHNYGEWFGDGKWLIFIDHLYNVETNEKREIKELPAYPNNYFRAVSPDLKTIIYQGVFCYSEYNPKGGLLQGADYVKTCAKQNEYIRNKIEIFWIIDAETGAAKFLELTRSKYPWLNGSEKSFQQQFVWQKDETGRDRLVYPN